MDVREKLVEIVKRASYCCLPSNTQDFHINMFVTDLLACGVTVQEWISVKDRLPEDDQAVKKHIEGETFGFLTVLVYNGVVKETNRFFSNEPRYGLPKTNGWEWASSNVTHWMPLPQPPKGE